MRRKLILIGALITALGLALVPMRSQAAPKMQAYVMNCNSSNAFCLPFGCLSNDQVSQLLQAYLEQCQPSLTLPWCQNAQENCGSNGCPDAPVVQTPEQSPATPVPQIPEPTPALPETLVPQPSPAVPETTAPAELSYEEQVVALVNEERAKAGLPALTIDATLQEAALARAKETVTLFSHTRPNGTSCFTILQEYGISYRYAGENIAYGQRSPEEVVNAWMNSEGHRANIMSANFTTIGIGYYQTANGTKYWSQLFIS